MPTLAARPVATPAATPFDFVGPDHFLPVVDPERARRLFQQSVSMVEIEVFSYCNRTCWFCPNSIVDRRSKTEYLPERLYLRLLEQLAEADYRQLISYSRYNEPLADRVILRRLEQAHTCLPHATLHTNTNGDYLTPTYLDDLASAGLRSLNIQIYLGNNDRYDHERMRGRLHQTIDRLGLDARVIRDDPGIWLEAVAAHADIRMRIYARNFERNGCNRGGSVPVEVKTQRTSPCLSPFAYVYVDYTGQVMPCCNLRSDLPAHADAVIADLNQTDDIFSVYAGAHLSAWRRSLVGFGSKGGHCASCNFGTYQPTPDHVAAQQQLVQYASFGSR